MINPKASKKREINNRVLIITEGVVCSDIAFPVSLREPKIAVDIMPLIPSIVKQFPYA